MSKFILIADDTNLSCCDSGLSELVWMVNSGLVFSYLIMLQQIITCFLDRK